MLKSLLLVICSIFLMGMNFNSTNYIPTMNNISVGSNIEDLLQNFGNPKFADEETIKNIKLKYYYYKNGNKIGIDEKNNKVVDIIIKDSSYDKKNKITIGATNFYVQKFHGLGSRQLIDGKTYLIYKSKNTLIYYRFSPSENVVDWMRITTLPVEDIEYDINNEGQFYKKIDLSAIDANKSTHVNLPYKGFYRPN